MSSEISFKYGLSPICAMCSCPFNRPKIFDCLHGWCLDCIKQLPIEENGNITCPSCMSMTIVPPEGIEKLQDDIYRLTMAERHTFELNQQSLLQCDECPEDSRLSAIVRCQICEKNFCFECKQSHAIARRTKTHQIEQLIEQDPNWLIISSRKCAQHVDQKLLVHCKTCAKHICVICAALYHRDHSLVDCIAQGIKIKETLKEFINRSAHRRMLLRQAYEITTEAMQRQSKRTAQLELLIEEKYESFYQVTKKRSNDLKINANRTPKQQLKRFDTIYDELDLLHVALTNASDFVMRRFCLSTNADRQLLIDRIEKLLRTNVQPITACLFMKHTYNLANYQAISDICSSIGSLIKTGPHLIYHPNCIATGPGIDGPVEVGHPFTFTVILKNWNGEQLKFGGFHIDIDIEADSDEIYRPDMIEDLNDGTYVISMTPKESGELFFNIKIDTKAIGNSPYSVHVSQPKNSSSSSTTKKKILIQRKGSSHTHESLQYVKSSMHHHNNHNHQTCSCCGGSHH